MQESDKQPPQPEHEVNDYLKRPYAVEVFFTPEECEKVIALSQQFPLIEGALGTQKSETVKDDVNSAIRESKIRWFMMQEDTMWVYEKFNAVMGRVNSAYRSNITGIECIQIACYADSGFYGWHMDIGKGKLSLRKLTFSIQLSDPDTYEGGELQFFPKDVGAEMGDNRGRGCATIFPSYLVHRVMPVTKGERYSMVAWVIGPPLR